MAHFWMAWLALGSLVELVAIGTILAGGPDRTFSAWTHAFVPGWLVAGVAGWFVVHSGDKQGTFEAVASTLAAIAAAWLTTRMIGG